MTPSEEIKYFNGGVSALLILKSNLELEGLHDKEAVEKEIALLVETFLQEWRGAEKRQEAESKEIT